MSKSNLVDLKMQLHHSTERSILVSDDGDRAKAVWLPLAHVEVEKHSRGMVTVTMPEWLATDKGLV